MFLHQILQASFRKELGLVLLQVKSDLRVALDPPVYHLGVVQLPNHGNDAASTHGLQERLGTRLGTRPEVVHELVLRKTDTRILKREGQIGLLWDEVPAPPPLPCTIREPTLGLPGAAPDRALGSAGAWVFPELSRRSTVQSSGQLLRRKCRPSSDGLAAPAEPLASSQRHQPGPPQGSGPDWLLSSPAHDKRASHRRRVVVVVVVVLDTG